MSFKNLLEEVATSLAASFAGRIAEHAKAAVEPFPAAAAAGRLGSELADLLANHLGGADQPHRPHALFASRPQRFTPKE